MTENTAVDTNISFTPAPQEILPVGRWALSITSTHVMTDEQGQPDRLLVNFRAPEAPAGVVVPPATFKISHPVGQEILANLLYAAGCRERTTLDQFPGLTVSGSLYINKGGWPTWGSWENAA